MVDSQIETNDKVNIKDDSLRNSAVVLPPVITATNPNTRFSEFKAFDYLGPEGKQFYEENRRWSSFSKHISGISNAIRNGLENGWIDDKYVSTIVEELGNVRNASDASQLEGKVEAFVIDPLQKPPSKVQYSETFDIKEFNRNIEALAKPLGLVHAPGKYVLDEFGQSLIYNNDETRELSSALTKATLTSYVLSTGDSKVIDYFSKLFSLPQKTPEIEAAAKALVETKRQNEEIIETLNDLPKPKHSSLPDISSLATATVMQGNSNSRIVSSKEVDLLGTFGMGPCVSVIIYQDGKAALNHIDDFSGNSSLGGQGASAFLNEALNNIDKTRDFDIHIIGGKENGRSTVLALYKTLKELGVAENIKSFDALAPTSPTEVTIDVRNGKLYPGEGIYSKSLRQK